MKNAIVIFNTTTGQITHIWSGRKCPMERGVELAQTLLGNKNRVYFELVRHMGTIGKFGRDMWCYEFPAGPLSGLKIYALNQRKTPRVL